MKEQLALCLEKIRDMLSACGLYEYAEWFGQRRKIVISDTTSPELFRQTVLEIRGVLAGMGSFTDLSLVPKEGSQLTEEKMRNRQWELADELDVITSSLLHEEHLKG